MIIYIAGKITGDPGYRDKFARVAAWLGERFPGCVVLNPAELPEGMESGDYMRICLAMLESADEIVMLPGWPYSRGATVEHDVSRYCGKRVRYLVADGADSLTAEDVNCDHLSWDAGRYGDLTGERGVNCEKGCATPL